jgi:hypothetical protein
VKAYNLIDIITWYDAEVDALCKRSDTNSQKIRAYLKTEAKLREVYKMKRYMSYRTFLICYERRKKYNTRPLFARIKEIQEI